MVNQKPVVTFLCLSSDQDIESISNNCIVFYDQTNPSPQTLYAHGQTVDQQDRHWTTKEKLAHATKEDLDNLTRKVLWNESIKN